MIWKLFVTSTSNRFVISSPGPAREARDDARQAQVRLRRGARLQRLLREAVGDVGQREQRDQADRLHLGSTFLRFLLSGVWGNGMYLARTIDSCVGKGSS